MDSAVCIFILWFDLTLCQTKPSYGRTSPTLGQTYIMYMCYAGTPQEQSSTISKCMAPTDHHIMEGTLALNLPHYTASISP